MPDYPPELWQRLPAAVLEGLLFARIWAIEDDARSVQAVHDAGRGDPGRRPRTGRHGC